MKFTMDYINNMSKCQKFQPNVFNKSKCQACFKGKDEHSAQALENNKNARKILLCDYFFVAPSSFNFDNPMDRTRRWQRRLFILFDDGELTYSIDENINTVPQGCINITTIQEISEAEELTSHKFSIGVVEQNGTKTFIKGANKEETDRLKSKLKSIVESAKPAKVKRNFTISHPPSSSDRKMATSILRNHFLSQPSLSTPDRSRVLSEISNRSIINDVTTINSYDNPSEPERSSLDALTYRNMRRLKNKSSSSLPSNIIIRKSLSLQTLSDGTSSDLDMLTSNVKKNSEEQRLSPPDLFSNLPENSPNVTIRSPKKKYRKKNEAKIHRMRSRSLCREGEQFPKGVSVLGAIRFWEERSRSCDAPKFKRSKVTSDHDSQSSDGYEKVPHRSRNVSRKFFGFQRPIVTAESSETLRNQSHEREYFDDFSLDDMVQQNIDYHSCDRKLSATNRRTSFDQTTTNQIAPRTDCQDEVVLRSGSLRSIEMKEDDDNNNYNNNRSSLPTSTLTIPRDSSCTWPYSTPSSPESKCSIEDNKDSCELFLISSQRDSQEQIKQKMEELSTNLLNKQNIISVVMSELLKLIHPSIHPSSRNINSDQYSLSEMRDILRSLNELVRKTNSEKMELQAALERSNHGNDSSNENLRAQNHFLSSNLADREVEIEKLKVEIKDITNEMRTKDYTNEALEKNLQQMKMSLKASEIKRGVLERRNSEMMDGVMGQMREESNRSASPCCIKLEKDALLQKVEGLQKTISGLEKDLLDEKFCRESARKSFLKELSDHRSREEHDKMQLKNIQDDFELLKIDRSNLSSALNEQNVKISHLVNDLNKVEHELKETLNQNDELTSMYKDSEQQIVDLTTTLDCQSKTILSLEMEIKKLMSENEELNIKFDFNVAERTCLSEELERLNIEFSEMEKEKNNLTERLNETSLSQRNEDKNQELEELKEYVEILENEMQSHQKMKEEMKVDHHKKVLQLECHIGELVERLKVSEKESIVLINKQKQVEGELKQRSATFADLETNLLLKDKHLHDVETQLLKLKSTEEVTEASKQRNNDTHLEQNKDLERNNSSLKQQVRKLEVDLEGVRSSSTLKVHELMKKLDLEQRRCSRFCDSLRRLGGDDPEELVKHLESLVSELENTKRKLQEAEEKLDHLQKQNLIKIDEDIINGGTWKDKEVMNQQCVEALEAKIKKLELQLKNVQEEHQREMALQRNAHRKELALSREESLKKLEDAEANYLPINEDNIRRKYSKDVHKIKELYNKGLHTLEKSQQQTIGELRRIHLKEMDKLRQEKEQLLEEEVAATQAALDAMRKAHEAELEKERQKFLDKLSQTYSHADMKALQKRHEEDVKFIEVEIRQLSEQYSIKCLENASLDERLKQQTSSLHDNRKRVQDLLARNEELIYNLKFETAKLHHILKNVSWDQIDADYVIDEIKEAISKIKHTEDYQLKEQLKNANLRLDGALEELKDLNEKHQNLCKKFESVRKSSNVSSLDANDTEREELDSTLTNSVCSDWSVGDQPPPTCEVPDRRSSKRLTWKFKGRNSKVDFDARLTLEKSKSVDSDHSISSIGFPDAKHFLVANDDDSEDDRLESSTDDNDCNNNKNNNKL